MPVMFQDREGYIWFGLNGEGVYRYDSQEWVKFGVQEGMADPSIMRAITQDRGGDIWFGTWNGGN